MAENSGLLNRMYVFSLTGLDVQAKVIFALQSSLVKKKGWRVKCVANRKEQRYLRRNRQCKCRHLMGWWVCTFLPYDVMAHRGG